MIEPVTPPPSYDAVNNSAALSTSCMQSEWYRKLTELQFTDEESTEYARLFVANEIQIGMIPELNDTILNTIGIEKAGHRIRILRLKNKSAPQTADIGASNIQRCIWHSNRIATIVCSRCRRPVCRQCSRKKPGQMPAREMCKYCSETCTVL